MTTNSILKPYAFFGLKLTSASGTDEVKTSCPFCEHHNNKLYIHKETGLFNCKHCTANGNSYIFLKMVHELCKSQTEPDHYKMLSEMRGIPWRILQENRLAYDDCQFGTKPRWLIPVFNQRNGVSNIRVWYPPTNKQAAATYGTAGMPLTLYRLDTLKGSGPIYVCEGEWDALALEYLRKRSGQKGSVLAVPGAQVFKKTWTEQLFNGRDVVFLYDNDGPGYEGMRKNAFTLQGKASSVRSIRWTSAFDEKYDIRDYVYNCSQDGQDYVEAWEGLHEMLVSPSDFKPIEPGSSAESDLPVRNSFRTVLADFRKAYHFTKNEENALAIICATIFSIQIPGDPIWIFLIAPPGAGKTMLLRSFEQSPYAVFRSSLTAHSLISGYQTSGEDPSLIPKLVGKCLIIKDHTEILCMNASEQDEIHGILRGAFDGRCEKTFGNGIHHCYEDCYFSVISGVTDVIHAEERATLGERFLKYQMISGHNYDATEHITKAVLGISIQTKSESFLRKVAASYTDKQIEKEDIPIMPAWLRGRLINLAQLVSYLRARVHRSQGDLSYIPTPEIGTRLAKQLHKLALCLAYVWGNKAAGWNEYELVKQVAFDTASGWPLAILKLFMEANEVVDIHYLNLRLKLSRSTIDKKIEDMLMLGLLDKEAVKGVQPGPGNPGFYYIVTPTLRKMWKTAHTPKPKRTSKHDG